MLSPLHGSAVHHAAAPYAAVQQAVGQAVGVAPDGTPSGPSGWLLAGAGIGLLTMILIVLRVVLLRRHSRRVRHLLSRQHDCDPLPPRLTRRPPELGLAQQLHPQPEPATAGGPRPPAGYEPGYEPGYEQTQPQPAAYGTQPRTGAMPIIPATQEPRTTALPIVSGPRTTALPIVSGPRTTALPIVSGPRTTALPIVSGPRTTALPIVSGPRTTALPDSP